MDIWRGGKGSDEVEKKTEADAELEKG
ncbi:uncharacterized protein G2W53_003073 [Senna tora]|uniref:Uncharacterized protein n=1 Tax=Senna tora TaxID=362788 RepID=A0A834X9M7_9FABA|nr:uncharacterized protein G2W53_003073 [Senna tora]